MSIATRLQHAIDTRAAAAIHNRKMLEACLKNDMSNVYITLKNEIPSITNKLLEQLNLSKETTTVTRHIALFSLIDWFKVHADQQVLLRKQWHTVSPSLQLSLINANEYVYAGTESIRRDLFPDATDVRLRIERADEGAPISLYASITVVYTVKLPSLEA